MITIYHNARCGKSREGLLLVEKSGKPFKIVNYLKEPLDEKALKSIILLLKIKPLDLVRQKEKIWIEEFKNKNLTDEEIISAMVENPILIERPIVVNEKKAVIGRPPENILSII